MRTVTPSRLKPSRTSRPSRRRARRAGHRARRETPPRGAGGAAARGSAGGACRRRRRRAGRRLDRSRPTTARASMSRSTAMPAPPGSAPRPRGSERPTGIRTGGRVGNERRLPADLLPGGSQFVSENRPRSAVGSQRRGENFQQCRLSRTVPSQEDGPRARGHGEGHVDQRPARSEAPAQALGLDGGVGHAECYHPLTFRLGTRESINGQASAGAAAR